MPMFVKRVSAMHELSLMQGVMDIVKESAAQNGILKVNKVKLVVGKFSMALPDSLQFAFEAISGVEPLIKGAVLEIETKEILCQCQQCQQINQLGDTYHFVCSSCGSTKIDIIQGRELYLDYYEGDEN